MNFQKAEFKNKTLHSTTLPTPNDGRNKFGTGQAGQALSNIEGSKISAATARFCLKTFLTDKNISWQLGLARDFWLKTGIEVAKITGPNEFSDRT